MAKKVSIGTALISNRRSWRTKTSPAGKSHGGTAHSYTPSLYVPQKLYCTQIFTHIHIRMATVHKACFPLWVTNALSLPCFKTSLVLCSISDFLITRGMLQRQHTIWFKFGNIFRDSNMQRCLHHANGFNTFSSLLLLMGQQGIDACSFAMLHQVM